MSARKDPFVAFRFELRIDAMPPAGFSEVSGLSLQADVHDHVEGGNIAGIHRFPGQIRQGNLTLKRGLADRTLWTWFYGMAGGQVARRNGSVLVFDRAAGQVAMEIQFYRAFPVRWVGPDLNAGQSQIAIETLELAHAGLRWV